MENKSLTEMADALIEKSRILDQIHAEIQEKIKACQEACEIALRELNNGKI